MKSVGSRWEGAILVCGKCSKRAGGGFGRKGKQRLAKLLRTRLGKGRKAPLGVVETKCLGLCPKRGVVLIDSRRPHEWRIVPPESDVDQLVASLAPPS